MRYAMMMAVLAVGCGIPAGKKLADLDDDDAKKLCEETEETTVTCEFEGIEIEITVGGDCDNAEVGDIPEDCEATVGDYRDCMDAVLDDPCAQEEPAECEAFYDCFDNGDA